MSANRYQPRGNEPRRGNLERSSSPRRPWKISRFFLFLSPPFFRSRGNNERWKSGIERAATYDNNEGGISIGAAFIAIRYATVQRNCGLSCDSKKRREKHFSGKSGCQSIGSIPPRIRRGRRGSHERLFTSGSPPGVINDRTLARLGRESSGIDQTNRINLERLLSGWNDPDRDPENYPLSFLINFALRYRYAASLPGDRSSVIRFQIFIFGNWKDTSLSKFQSELSLYPSIFFRSFPVLSAVANDAFASRLFTIANEDRE